MDRNSLYYVSSPLSFDSGGEKDILCFLFLFSSLLFCASLNCFINIKI